jgi:hypothetical protein
MNQTQVKSEDNSQIYKSAAFILQGRKKQGEAVAEREKMSLIATCPAIEPPLGRHR